MEPPFITELRDARSVLLAGAGGGFDLYAGLPLWTWLRREGVDVHLASLTFSNTDAVEGERIEGLGVEVDADSPQVGENAYFPERALCRWARATHDVETTVMCIRKSGVGPMKAVYRSLVKRLGLDAIVLLDGGVDILLRGDETSLGTPAEDATSLLAVAATDVPTRLVVCLGFGTDRRHGVRHAEVLARMAELTAGGAARGGLWLPPEHPDMAAYLDAVDFAFEDHGGAASYVSHAVAASARGHYGPLPPPSGSSDRPAWCSALSATFYAFELEAVADQLMYRDLLERSQSIGDVTLFIHGVRKSLGGGPGPEGIPL